jgi:predicted house-cleaning noncanonical NTP pyrophosphatase (MazG superfamily)
MANHNICEDVEASQDASQRAGKLACEEEFDKELKEKVPPDVGKDLTEEKLEDLADIQNPMVSIVTDFKDTVEDQEVTECTKNKIDEAKSNDDGKDVKNCYMHQSFGILDCIEISEDSPEEISGDESIGRSTLCSLEPDVATFSPLYYVTKRGRRYANDDKRLEISENSNFKNFSYTSLVMEADSTEQLSLTQEYKDLATMPLMGKVEDQMDDSMDSVYNREEKQAMSATAQVSEEDQSVAKTCV